MGWASGDLGAFSAAKVFVVKEAVQNWGGKVDDNVRFSPALGKSAYLDNETGLVWDVMPAAETEVWASAVIACGERIVGGRKGFRLPTREELLTLVLPEQKIPHLPAGHPFKLGGSPLQTGSPNLIFWTQTDHPSGADGAMVVDFVYGVSKAFQKTYEHRYWCVRAPTAHAH